MKGQSSTSAKTHSLALRKEMTEAERRLWSHLRGGQLGHKFRRQHPFREFILDFVCLEAHLVIEVDGGQHAEQVTQDELRTKVLQAAGFRVLRFWNNEVLGETEAVVGVIAGALTPSPPPPSP